MANSSDAPKPLREIVSEAVARIGGWAVSQLATYMMSPKLGLAVSIAVVSILALRRAGVAIRMRKREKLLEYVRDKVVDIQLEIDQVKERISLLNQAYRDVKEEDKKVSIERQLETAKCRLEKLNKIKSYFESLLNAIESIEPLRHIYGDEVDKVYEKISELSVKASEGKISEEDLSEAVERISHLADSTPDFPHVLLEVAREKLG